MIQRIQSLFLLIVLLLSILLNFIPVFEYNKPVGEDLISGSPETIRYFISQKTVLFVLNIAISSLALFTIFLYKKRNLQIRLTGLSLLLTSIMIFLLFFLADSYRTDFDNNLKYLYGTYCPIVQLVLSYLAQRAIRKDEELVRSADRLR
ncbi:MAG: DUF4293 domain-containing protein [Bacteroidota bacterium]